MRSLDGPWLLYDNDVDPYQMNNVIDCPNHAHLVDQFDRMLTARLKAMGDDFAPGPEIIKREGYALGPGGDIALMPSELPEPYHL